MNSFRKIKWAVYFDNLYKNTVFKVKIILIKINNMLSLMVIKIFWKLLMTLCIYIIQLS